MPPSTPIEDRFWSKVDKTDGCWLWTGSLDTPGYGLLCKGVPRKGNIRASIYSFLLHFGPYDRRLQVCHTCDVPRCVRPDHLFLGTAHDNSIDMVRKGRHGRANARKTHCKRGHLFSDENTYITKSGGRACRECHRQHMAERRAK